MQGSSAPVILLSLGALCLLVAAIVFVAVAWSVIGMTGRTLILLGITSALVLVAREVTRRGLRAAAETLWLLVAGMLAVDLVAARAAELPGFADIGGRGMGLLVGGTLALSGAAAAYWARSRPVRRLYGAQCTAALGLFVATASNGWAAEDPAVGSVIAVVLLVGIALATHRPLPIVGFFTAGLALLSWLVLGGVGLDRATDTSHGDWFLRLDGWPLLACAALAAVPALLSRLPQQLRTVAAFATLASVAAFAQAPGGTDTRNLLTASGTTAVLGAISLLAPLVWSRAAGLGASLGGLLLGGTLTTLPAASLPTGDGTAAATDPLRHVMRGFEPAPWVWLLVGAAVLVALVGLTRHIPDFVRSELCRTVFTLLPAGVAMTVGGALTATTWAVWVPTAAYLGATAMALAAPVVRTRDRWALVGGGAVAVLAIIDATRVSLASNALLAGTVTVIALLLGSAAVGVRPHVDREVAEPVLATSAVLFGGATVPLWMSEAGATDATIAWVVAVGGGLVLVAGRFLPTIPVTRLGVESAGAVLGLVSLGIAGTERGLALGLMILGTATALSGVLHRDRELLRWLGAGVLFVAMLVRIDAGVSAPELATLPGAALLLGAGVWRMVRDEDAASWFALSPGLSLALVPSLLLALEDPVSLRGVLIAAGALMAIALGVGQRWQAPLVLGSATAAVLALRHLTPIADAVPRWISLGGVGLVLLLVGVTWEQRLKDVEGAGRYVRELR